MGQRPAPTPLESAARCALRAQLRGDPMLGTAFPAQRLLLVEQPGPWGRGGLTASRFPTDVAVRLERRAAADGIRLQAVRRPGRTPAGAVRHWALVDTSAGRESVRWATYTEASELLTAPLDGSVGEPDDDPIYLVCAHSKHDACCALRGRPVAAALDEQAPGQVWESSHLGGDRFAANVLVLPSGLMYGRLLPFAAAQFVAAARADEVVAALLRGRIGLAPAAQAALAFGFEQLAVRDRHALTVAAVGPTVDGVVVVRLAAPSGEHFDVVVRVEARSGDRLTCRAPGPGRFLAYRPVTLTPVSVPRR